MDLLNNVFGFLSGSASNPVMMVIGLLTGGGIIWKLLDGLILDFILKHIKPELIIKRFIRKQEKSSVKFLARLKTFDDSYLDANKKKMPKAIQKIEKSLVVGLRVSRNLMTNTINEAIKIIEN